MPRGAVAQDLTGQTFGLLTALERVANHKGRVSWACSCACGGSTSTTAASLIYGNTKSCGCLQARSVRNSLRVDLTGQVFGRLTVLAETPRSIRGRILWACSCSCGKAIEITGNQLKANHTKSCGCLGREALRARNSAPRIDRAMAEEFPGLTEAMKEASGA